MKRLTTLLLAIFLCSSAFSQQTHNLTKSSPSDKLLKRYQGRFKKFDVLTFDHHAINAQLKKDKKIFFYAKCRWGGQSGKSTLLKIKFTAPTANSLLPMPKAS